MFGPASKRREIFRDGLWFMRKDPGKIAVHLNNPASEFLKELWYDGGAGSVHAIHHHLEFSSAECTKVEVRKIEDAPDMLLDELFTGCVAPHFVPGDVRPLCRICESPKCAVLIGIEEKASGVKELKPVPNQRIVTGRY